MITVKSSEQHTGVVIAGDYLDMQTLYDALHEVVGEEGEYGRYEGARLRVLGVCYDIRHSLMGDREVSLEENGIDREMMKRLNVITSEHNLYFNARVLWPELLFVQMALNDFILLHIAKLTKKHYRGALHKHAIWDASIAAIRQFQSAVMKEIANLVTPVVYTRMMGYMVHDYTCFDRYTTQYIDVLNIDWINMTPDQRLKSLSTMAKRLSEKGKAYQILHERVQAAAKQYNTTEHDISAPEDYPEEFEW
ncbi:DUF6904 family protein [Paenibacillus sp. strain BS8-2]